MLNSALPDEHPFVRRPHRTLLRLTLPVLISLIAEPLTGLADTAFIARLGAAPLAALGVGTVLMSSVFWVFNFLGIGTQTEVAHATGSADAEGARDATGLALALATAIGCGIALLGWPFLDAAARFMSNDVEVQNGAVAYLRIRLLAAPAVLVTVAAFGALRGLQDMRTPLRIALGINALNLALDPLLIFGAGPVPALGIAGAAWATLVAQTIGAVAAWLVAGATSSIPTRPAPTAPSVRPGLWAGTGICRYAPGWPSTTSSGRIFSTCRVTGTASASACSSTREASGTSATSTRRATRGCAAFSTSGRRTTRLRST
jgi:Na+-driven multidrug efflux pump